MSTSPTLALYNFKDDRACLYCQILFALRERQVSTINAMFTSMVYTMLQFMRQHWRDIIADIRSGSLDGLGDFVDSASEAHLVDEVRKYNRADAVRADELEAIFSCENRKGLCFKEREKDIYIVASKILYPYL